MYAYLYIYPLPPQLASPHTTAVSPLQVITEHQAGLPVLHSFPRAICFTHGSVYMSVLLSQFYPLPFFSLLPHFLCFLPSINPQRILRLKEETQWEEAAFYYRSPWNQCLRAPDWIQTLCCIWGKQLSLLWGRLYTHTYTHSCPAAWNDMWKYGNEIKHAHQLKPFLLTAHIRLWAAGSREQCQGTGHLTWFLCGEFQTIIIKFREVWCHASGSGITHMLWANHVTSIFIACNYICGDRRGWLDEAPSVITA